MDMKTLKARVRNVDPLVADIALAVGLALLVCLQLWVMNELRPPDLPPRPGTLGLHPEPQDFGALPYVLASCAFLPLAVRRRVPWLALLLSGAATALYVSQPLPQAFVTLGPMIALYTLAAHAKRRHTGLLTLLAAGLIVAVPIFAFSAGGRWVADTVGTLTLLAAAALLGDTARNRREYIAEVEARAIEAERTREEEALRRVEEERMLIAREVHDIVAHSLSIVTVQAAAAEAVLDTDPQQARESIRNIRAAGREALGELRSMLDVLRTGETDNPLAPAADLTQIESLLAPMRETGLEIDLRVSGDLTSVPAYASLSAYRIVQEALTNVVRHAAAHHVAVTIVANGRELTLRVADDGGGRPSPGEGEPEANGHGLRGMRERVEALGGTFTAGPGASSGFEVTAAIPLSRSAS